MSYSIGKKVLLAVPVIAGISYLAFQQIDALKQATVNLLGIERVKLSSGFLNKKLLITPNLEIQNPSLTSVQVDSVNVAADVQEGGGWVRLGNNTRTISANISPNGRTIIQPELEFPLANVASVALKSFINNTTDFTIRIRAIVSVAGKDINVEEIMPISI